jgi:NAD-dependent DNA ligase
MSDIYPEFTIDTVAKTVTFSYESFLTANGGSLDAANPTEVQIFKAQMKDLNDKSIATLRADPTKKICTSAQTNLENKTFVVTGTTTRIRRQVIIDMFESDTSNSFDPDN